MNEDAPAPTQAVPQLVEHLFRHEHAKMVAVLTHIFGIENFELAEDVVQEALARALQTWPFYGVPENPSAWLIRAARNVAVDVFRRQKSFREKEDAIITEINRNLSDSAEPRFSDQEIADDRLRLIFVCCHPHIAADNQVALALKTLCGFGINEIAKAFLTTDAAIAKRLTRAKQKVREADIRFEIPAGAELNERLDGVLKSVYLLFNEGYKASAGDQLIRADICAEAIRLGTLLAEHPCGNKPRVHALLALMLFNAARASARTDAEGNLLLLSEQDRSRWDKAMIARGMFHLAQSAAGGEITEYHLQAAIAALHCAAPDYDSTEWKQILALYDQLLRLNDSPIVALNRAVALAEIEGPEAAIAAIDKIPDIESLNHYHLYYAVRGELYRRAGNLNAAAENLRKAMGLAELKSEKSFLARRLQLCEQPATSS